MEVYTKVKLGCGSVMWAMIYSSLRKHKARLALICVQELEKLVIVAVPRVKAVIRGHNVWLPKSCPCLCDYAATVLVVTSLSLRGFVVWYATPISVTYITIAAAV